VIRVLVVEDSPVAGEMIRHILETEPRISVIGVAANGREAIEAVGRDKPDLITMDINMPVLDGFEATRIIMETDPLPIVIVTGSSDVKEVETSFRAIEAGALAVLQKPLGIGHPDYASCARELITTVRVMSEVRVVKRWPKGRSCHIAGRQALQPGVSLNPDEPLIDAVAIGASTGGPSVLQTILSALPASFPVPALVVQHMSEGFIQGFAEWLDESSALSVSLASDGVAMEPGHVYIAPDGVQMRVENNGTISCKRDDAATGHRPSVACLFRSVSEVFGRNAAAVLLTGMGIDGTAELKMLREKGAVTIAQDEESSAVFGMPGEAVRLNAATYVAPPDRIVAILSGLAARKAGRACAS
jgi:two-component system chemotaxis response regulator CheB